MHRREFRRRVAHYFRSSVRDMAKIYGASPPVASSNLLAFGRFDRRPLDHIKPFLAVMDVERNEFAGLKFGGRNDDLHLRPG